MVILMTSAGYARTARSSNQEIIEIGGEVIE